MRYGMRTTLFWIPDHANIAGNEIADQLGKKAAKESMSLNEQYNVITMSDVKQAMKTSTKTKWQNRSLQSQEILNRPVFCVRYSEKSLKILKITKNSEQILNIAENSEQILKILKIAKHSEQILNITENSEQILNIVENSEQILNRF